MNSDIISKASFITVDGITFRDLNKNGKLDPYEDYRLPIEVRVNDLLSQMKIEEKVGLMFHDVIDINPDGTIMEKPSMLMRCPTQEFIDKKKMNHFYILKIPAVKQVAKWQNKLQKLAENTRLGIPATISSDPRHGFTYNPATSGVTVDFSKWPEPIGLAAIGDEAVVKEFSDIARQEYIAVGIRVAVHPMADLATEPRWARIHGTFGEDAELASRMIYAYIKGFQGEVLGPKSVACITKHFPGAGPQKDGEDPHFTYGKDQVYPGRKFDYHLKPFEAAFKAGTTQIMPYYGRPVGLPLEEVGFGFNKNIITGLLRKKYGFDGVVCTDFHLIHDLVTPQGEKLMDAKAWGVERLNFKERVKKAVDAGIDQFGGEACTEILLELIRSGEVTEARINESARRLLRDKFRLGLFDNPYVDTTATEKIVGNPDFRKAGETAQRKAITLLKNGAIKKTTVLPLSGRPRIYIEGIDPKTAGEYGQVVDRVEDAEVAIIRLKTPYEPRQSFFESFFHAGDLDFKGKEKERILNLISSIPTIVDIYLARPAVIPEIVELSTALLADFGATDAAVLDVIFGRFTPTGKLPFELPSSMEAVKKQKEDVPYDSENPIFPFGFSLTY